jgi:SAM-dependent methyltransferase
MPARFAEASELYPKSGRVLELGCGHRRRVPGSVGVDANPTTKADVIHDLNVFPYPFPSNEFDAVIAEHVLEHLENVIGVMEEIHRIAKPGAKVFIEVPHYTSQDFYTDPTHRHSFTSTSMDYFIPGSGGLYDFGYSATARFKKISVALGHRRSSFLRRWYLDRILRRDPLRYERQFAFLFPVDRINFVLEVLK